MIKRLKKQAKELIINEDYSQQQKGYGMLEVIEKVEEFYVPRYKSVVWNEEDFENRSKHNHKDNWKNIYDKYKFDYALTLMVFNHDANLGITWKDVDFWLDEVCKKQLKFI